MSAFKSGPSYRESNKWTKKEREPTLDVHFTEMSALQRVTENRLKKRMENAWCPPHLKEGA